MTPAYVPNARVTVAAAIILGMVIVFMVISPYLHLLRGLR